MLKTRFKNARIAAGLTQLELAAASHSSQSAINKIELGQTLRPRNIERFAEIMNTSAEFLQYGSSDETTGRHLFVGIPLYGDAGLAAGNGYVATADTATESIPISRKWVLDRKLLPEKLVVVRVYGDSMMDRIYNNDMVIVNVAENIPQSGKIYAIAVGDELRLKRLHLLTDGSWLISSDNQTVVQKDEKLTNEQMKEIRIIGRARSIFMADL